MKTFFKIVRRTLGVLAILFGVLMAFTGYLDPHKSGIGFTVFCFAIGVLGPFFVGYLLILSAEETYDSGYPKPYTRETREKIFKLGYALILFFLCMLMASLPNKGRIILLSLFLLIGAAEAYVRIHFGWSSEKIQTPLGPMDRAEAEVFGFMLGGLAFLAVEGFLAFLSGGISLASSAGRAGFVGGGGSSGGGGASGKW